MSSAISLVYAILFDMVGLNQEQRKRLGSRFKKAREEKKMTQEELAKKAHVSVNYYARIERGEENPRIDIINKIIKALGINSSQILPL